MCRRSHIMTVFSTVGAQVGSEVRCDYCDNCGFHNSWDEGAIDITAGLSEQKFREDIRALFSKQSKDESFLINNIDYFFNLTDKMVEENYVKMAETISDAWLEQIGEKENIATNLMLAIIHGKESDLTQNRHYMNTVFNTIKDDVDLSQKIIVNLNNRFLIDLSNIYRSHFYQASVNEQLKALKIFSSSDFEVFKDVETEIGLNLVETQLNKFDSVLSKYEKMEA